MHDYSKLFAKNIKILASNRYLTPAIGGSLSDDIPGSFASKLTSSNAAITSAIVNSSGAILTVSKPQGQQFYRWCAAGFIVPYRACI